MSVLDKFWCKLASQVFYWASIKKIRLRLTKLQANNKQTKKIKWKTLTKDWGVIEEVLYHKDFPYI